MERYLTNNMIQSILITLVIILAAIRLLFLGFSYPFALLAIAYLVLLIIICYERRTFKENRKLGETLFLREFGVKPDKVEPLLLPPVSKYRLKEGISKKSFYIKFLSQGKVLKGVIDKENQVLYMEEPVLLPVYADDTVSAWKYVVKIHSNGKPKKVVYYDENEQLCGEEYLDENGVLKRASWRRLKGIEVYWNPKKQVWEP